MWSWEALTLNLGREIFEPVLKGFGIEIARALVEHARYEGRNARLAVGVLGGPAGKGELQAEDRPGVVLDEPGLDALFAGNFLDFHRVCWKCCQKEEGKSRGGCRGGEPEELAAQG